jgi:hypothetical protein
MLHEMLSMGILRYDVVFVRNTGYDCTQCNLEAHVDVRTHLLSRTIVLN